MNPFELRGPEFLLFYGAVVIAAAAWVIVARWFAEGGPPPKVDLGDPYLLAMLRDGANEAIAVAVTSLVDRGLLEVDGVTVVASAPTSFLRRPLEEAIHHAARTPTTVRALVDDPGVARATRALEAQLEGLRLLPDDAQRRDRRGRIVIATAAALGVAGVKLLIAISRGRSNVGFLILLAFGAAVLLSRLRGPRRTVRGDALLRDARTLFAALPGRAHEIRPGGATSELALLAAVFGVTAVPMAIFPHAGLFLSPPPAKASFFDGGSPGSSSCGSASSCGSSCGGGGGCGGGCGGCGG